VHQSRDLAISVAAILLGKLDNIGCETVFVFTTTRDFALCRAVLPKRCTGATLGTVQLRSPLLNADSPTRAAQKFPRAASRRMSLSSVRSDTALAQPAVLKLMFLQALHLIDLQTAKLLPPVPASVAEVGESNAVSSRIDREACPVLSTRAGRLRVGKTPTWGALASDPRPFEQRDRFRD
jgi:hypothetical protein